jgi:DNA-binding IclR family transcriptional regulator
VRGACARTRSRGHARSLSTQNERLTAVLTEVHHEQERMTAAKSAVMQALGMGDLNITDVLAHNKAASFAKV